MKLEKLSRLISALAEPSQGAQTKKTELTQAEDSNANTEAVRISQAFGRTQEAQPELSERERRVQGIKEQVAAGSYRPDTRKVAEALATELFA